MLSSDTAQPNPNSVSPRSPCTIQVRTGAPTCDSLFGQAVLCLAHPGSAFTSHSSQESSSSSKFHLQTAREHPFSLLPSDSDLIPDFNVFRHVARSLAIIQQLLDAIGQQSDRLGAAIPALSPSRIGDQHVRERAGSSRVSRSRCVSAGVASWCRSYPPWDEQPRRRVVRWQQRR